MGIKEEEKANKIFEIDQAVEDGILHPFEGWIIKKWRHELRFAKFSILIQDGIPQGIEEGIENKRPKDDGIKI